MKMTKMIKPKILMMKKPRLVAHACNPSSLGGRDQEIISRQPWRANSIEDPVMKNPITKGAGRVVQEALSSNPRATKRKKKKEIRHSGSYL
jgi:hypothetical protein